MSDQKNRPASLCGRDGRDRNHTPCCNNGDYVRMGREKSWEPSDIALTSAHRAESNTQEVERGPRAAVVIIMALRTLQDVIDLYKVTKRNQNQDGRCSSSLGSVKSSKEGRYERRL